MSEISPGGSNLPLSPGVRTDASSSPAGTSSSAASLPAGRPLSRAALHDLAEREAIDGAAFEGALRLIGVRPAAGDWGRFWFRLLTLCGSLLLASGVIFFIAWNWNGLHHFAKFGILEGVIAAGVLIAVWRGVDSMAGAAALTAAGLCMGPLLAVFGQTYMSGAHSWELFRAWACMLLPFALLGRQAGLWFLVWLTAGVWGLGFAQHMSQSDGFAYGLPEFILMQMAAVALWEAALRRTDNAPDREWLKALWLPRLMVFFVTALLTALTVILITEDWAYPYDTWGDDWGEALFLPFRPTVLAAYALGQAALYFWYRRKRRDLFMLACGVFSACAVAVTVIARAEPFAHADVAQLLFWGLTIAGLTALCGKLLLYWQRAMDSEENGGATEPHDASASGTGATGTGTTRDLFGSARLVRNWPGLWDRLTECGLWPETKARPAPSPAGAPWYVSTMLSAGGWVSAVLLMGFLGFLLFSTLNIGRDFETPLLLGGAIFLGIGAACSRLPGLFARQFGLASAIAGAVAASIGLAALVGSERYWPLPCLLVCLPSFLLIQNRAYRYIVTVFSVFFLYALLDAVFWGTHARYALFSYYDDAAAAATAGYSLLIGMSFFWAALCVFLGWCWSEESRWMTQRRFALALPALLHGAFTAMLLLIIASLATQHAYGYRELYHLLPPRASFGLGAAAGFIAMVFLLGRGASGHGALGGDALLGPEKAASGAAYRLACSLLTLPMGWYLPGVPLALLGFLISRYIGNKVLLGASALFLAAYLLQFYYNLETTLLHKSLSLMGCGLVLLAAAALMNRLFAPADAGDAAHGAMPPDDATKDGGSRSGRNTDMDKGGRAHGK